MVARVRRAWVGAVASFAILLLSARTGSGHAAPHSVEDVGPRVRRLLGDDIVSALLRARRAEVFELEAPLPKLRDPAPLPATPGTISGYRPLGKSRPLDDALFDGFRTLLLDSQTYTNFDLPPNMGVGKGCGPFRPGVAIRFWGDDKKGPTYVDALLCFFCADVALVLQDAASAPRPYDMHAGERSLLRLASAALPKVEFLSQELARLLEEGAREALFLSMFPASTQVAMDPPVSRLDLSSRPRDHDAFVRSAAERLAKGTPGPELLVMVARAFGIRRLAWNAYDNAIEIALAATKQLPIEEIAAGLNLASADQVALAGAAELAFRGGLRQEWPTALQEEWWPRLAEAAIVVSPESPICPLLDRLAGLSEGKGRLVLDRVAKGELRQAQRRWIGFADPASARGCALLARVKHNDSQALADAKAWNSVSPVDQATQRAVFFLAGEASALDGTVLGVQSNEVADSVLDWFRAHPTREHIDLLVGVVVAAPTDSGVYRVEQLLKDLAGAKIDPGPNATLEVRVAALRSWWAGHSSSWRMPATGSQRSGEATGKAARRR